LSAAAKRAWFLGAALALAAVLLAPPLAAAPAGKTDLIDLNSATQKQLETLPGVDPAIARKIIAARPYAAVSELARAGVPAEVILQIAPLVKVGPAAAAGGPTMGSARGPRGRPGVDLSIPPTPKKLDLNTASEKELRSLPGVGAVTARRIINNRPYASVEDLARAGVPPATITRIAPLAMAGPVPGTAGAAGAAMAEKESGGPAAQGSAAATGAASSAPPPAPIAPVTPPAAAVPSPALAPSATPGTPAGGAAAPAGQPPVKGMVWVDLDRRIYYFEGDRFYGNTKHGQYMTESDAIAAGYHPTKGSGRS
jgi:DNA uptake protein ComE-like DNA-binding protein